MAASRTGAATDRDIKFSGFSSQRGVPGRDPSLDGPGDTGVFGAVGVSVREEGTTLSKEELVYTGMETEAEERVMGRLLSSRDTAESVEERRAVVDLASSLALSELSGTLPLLPELVSSDRPLSTPSIL